MFLNFNYFINIFLILFFFLKKGKLYNTLVFFLDTFHFSIIKSCRIYTTFDNYFFFNSVIQFSFFKKIIKWPLSPLSRENIIFIQKTENMLSA